MKVLSPLAPASVAVSLGATTPNPGVTGAVIWSTTEARLLTWSGTNWASLSVDTYVPITSDTSTTLATLVSVTGGGLTIGAAGTYEFEWDVRYTATGGTALKLGLTGPTFSTLTYSIDVRSSDTAVSAGSGTAYSVILGATTSQGTGIFQRAKVEGVIYATASGTLQLQMASYIGSSSVTVKGPGSYGKIRKLA